MRPLIVDLGREYRGGQHQALLLLKGLQERGHAPELVTVRDSLLACVAKETGVPVHEVGVNWRRLAATAAIRRIVRDRRIDLLHANEPHALSSAWLARVRRGIPIVVSRRIALPISRGPLALGRYRAAARVIAVSRFVERSVLQSGLPAERVVVIHDGVEIPAEKTRTERGNARRQFGLEPEIVCIGNVAAFVPEKGHALLLDAFATLREKFPRSALLLRGEGPEQANLQDSARRLGIADAVKFAPPATEIGTLLAATDVFAFPSHEEPLGSALLAAMARGLPCVAIARGGIPEIVRAEKNGLLVEGPDPKEFASMLARCIANPDEAARMGRAARETVLQDFSAKQMAEETLELYERVRNAKKI